ncbi:hypothetical protein MSHI_35600 [Mycobacterium shinjukuense]|uniref:Vegetative cell wall protein n=2 Tax=Mycobacterium shinjukuense TaxID=398694 RepID=A0A7I7MTP5_9MYCO|nr:hypothetical protein MSHI_35600 [Mycobacterium shinjukuense]
MGGLWPAELSSSTAETAALAEHLEADLQLIVSAANDQLMSLRRAGMVDSARRAAEATVIDGARAAAVRRVELTMRRLRPMTRRVATASQGPPVSADSVGTDLDTTRVLPAARAVPPEWSAVRHPEPDHAGTSSPARVREDDDEGLRRLLAFVARQEPRVNWAVGAHADGTTVLVTDLAHGWIPSGITLPEGVRLLAPERRTGGVSALIGSATRCQTYTPGDSLRWLTDPTGTTPSMRPRELPAVDDLGGRLSRATHRRDGLPRLAHTIAGAATAGAVVTGDEADLLRVHLDTARSQVLAQYPKIDTALLLNCMLLAATEAFVVGDPVSANYHFSWFQELGAPAAGQSPANVCGPS